MDMCKVVKKVYTISKLIIYSAVFNYNNSYWILNKLMYG